MNSASKDFYDRAKNFAKVNSGMLVVIHTTPDPADAERENRILVDWFTYLSVRGLTSTLASFQNILGGAGKAVTLPCENPEMFDPGYVAPVHKWRKPEPKKGERTRNIGALVAATKASLKAAKPYGDKGRVRTPEEIADDGLTPQQRATKWLAEYQENPPPIPVFSDEMKKELRINRNFDPPMSRAAE